MMTAEEKKAYNAEYARKNRKRIAVRSKKYREENKERLKAYRLEHKVHIAARSKKYREEHKEHYAALYADYKVKNRGRIAAYREKNKERDAAKTAAWYRQNREKIAVREAASLQALRNRAYDMYGLPMKGHEHDVCSCPGCGADLVMFGTLSHIDGSGKQHRQATNGSVEKMLKDAIAAYDPTRFAAECFNCNCAAARNGGICPHKED